MPKVFLGEMSWVEAKELLKTVQAAIIPTGSTEQHGPHLPLQHDILSATYVSRKAAERLYPRVLVAPPVPAGASSFHMNFPGTITLRYETFIELLLDMTRSLVHHGVKRVVYVNGHGGNAPPLLVTVRRVREELGLKAACIPYWILIPKPLIKEVLGDKDTPGHASDFETSTALYTHPELVNTEALRRASPKRLLQEDEKIAYINRQMSITWESFALNYMGWRTDEFTDTGVFPGGGEPAEASEEKGRRLMEGAVDGLTVFLEHFMRQ